MLLPSQAIVFQHLSALSLSGLSYVNVDNKTSPIPPSSLFFSSPDFSQTKCCQLFSPPVLYTFALQITTQAQVIRLTHLLSLPPLYHPITTSLSLELCFAMSRPGVVPIIPPRSRQLWTPDIWMPPPKDADHAAAVMRVNARLAQRAAAKASADVMRVQARLAQRAAAKASAPSVGAMRPEVPRVSRVPRVASQQWQNAPTLESKESSLKGMCRSDPTSSPFMASRSLQHSHSANSSCAIR